MGYVGKVTAGGSTHLVGSTLYGTCSTTAATTVKVVTCADFDQLVDGVTIHVKFTNGNNATEPALNVNSTGSKLVKFEGANGGNWRAGAVVSFTYDSGVWLQNDTFYTDKNVQQVATSDTNTYPVLLTYTANASSTGTDSVRFATGVKVKTSNGYLIAGKFSSDGTNFYEIGAAAEKAIGSVTDGDTGLVTGDAVYDAIANAIAGQAEFMGTVGTSGATYTQAQLEALAYKSGMYFVCATSGTFVGETCEAGDMIWCVSDKGASYSASDFSVVQENIDTISNADIDTIVAS